VITWGTLADGVVSTMAAHVEYTAPVSSPAVDPVVLLFNASTTAVTLNLWVMRSGGSTREQRAVVLQPSQGYRWVLPDLSPSDSVALDASVGSAVNFLLYGGVFSGPASGGYVSQELAQGDLLPAPGGFVSQLLAQGDILPITTAAGYVSQETAQGDLLTTVGGHVSQELAQGDLLTTVGAHVSQELAHGDLLTTVGGHVSQLIIEADVLFATPPAPESTSIQGYTLQGIDLQGTELQGRDLDGPPDLRRPRSPL